MNLDFFKIFFKKHKILSVFLIILYILTVSASIFLLVQWVSVSTMDFPTERHYVTYMKGVWAPAAPFLITKEDIAQMKDDNMNTLSLGPTPGPLSITTLRLIKEAKKQGMAVHIAPQVVAGWSTDGDISDKKLEKYTKGILKLAELCEKYGVEYFSPMNEADLALGRNRAVKWHAEILPEIREVYSGKVIAKWSCWADDDSADDSINNESEAYVYRVKASKDFDGVMLDYASPTPFQFKYMFDASKEKEEGDDYRPCSLEEIVIATSQAAEEIGIPIYVGEFYVEVAEAPFGLTSDRKIFNEEEHAEYVSKFLDIVMPHYDGVLNCFWRMPRSGSIRNTPAEQVVKEKFGKY